MYSNFTLLHTAFFVFEIIEAFLVSYETVILQNLASPFSNGTMVASFSRVAMSYDSGKIVKKIMS